MSVARKFEICCWQQLLSGKRGGVRNSSYVLTLCVPFHCASAWGNGWL